MAGPAPSDIKRRLSLTSGGGLALVAALVALVNIVTQKPFLRFDWTHDHRYSLSPATKNTLKTLQDPLQIKLYMTEGLPQPYGTLGRYVKDLVEEYRRHGRGHVTVEVIAPEKSEKNRQAAMAAGMVSVRFTQVSSDQYQAREGYLGLALFYQDKQESIPFVRDVDSLEYDLSTRIKRMITPKKPVLGVVAGHGELSPDKLRSGDTAALFQLFEVQTISLSTAATHSKCDLIFVWGPDSAYSASELEVLEDEMARGVPVAFFVSQVRMNLQGGFLAYPRETGLAPFLLHYGVRLDKDVVLDMQCQRISMQSQQGGYILNNILNYPALPVSNTLNKNHVLTKSFDYLSFPFAHALTFQTAPGSGLKLTALAESSPNSWVSPGRTQFEPYSLEPALDNPRGPFILAATVEGSTKAFTSAEKDIPSVRMLVIGTGYLGDPGVPNPDPAGRFIVSAAQWLTQDPQLLAIPNRGSPFRPIKQLSARMRQVVKGLGFIFLPALVLAGGFFHWRHRQETRRRIEELFRARTPAAPPTVGAGHA